MENNNLQKNKSTNTNAINAGLDSNNTQFQIKYQQNGLTTVSNNNSVIPRDSAGNIALHEGDTKNPLLIIEPITTKITTKSMLKVLDTRFQYFKFPATTRIIDDTEVVLDLELDLPDESELTTTTDTTDLVYARYKPAENRRIPQGNPNAGYDTRPSGIEMSEVVDGIAQTQTNKYYVTKEVKSSGADLRFRIKINHRFDSDGPEKSNTFYFISRTGPNKYLIRNYLGPFATTSRDFPNDFGSIARYEVQDVFIDTVIRNSEFEAGDEFGITAFCAAEETYVYHTINSEQSYWSITDASKNVDTWNQEIK